MTRIKFNLKKSYGVFGDILFQTFFKILLSALDDSLSRIQFFIKNTGASFWESLKKTQNCLLKKKKKKTQHKNPKQTDAAERKGEPRNRMIEKELWSA